MTALAYYELKAAQALFAKSNTALDEQERRKVRAVAQRYRDIEAVVLGSDEARGVCLAEGAVDHALGELRARYDEADGWHAALQAHGLDADHITGALRRDLLVDAVLARVGARAGPVGAVETEIFYYAHLDRFRTPARRLARHILITVNEDIDDNRRDAARRRIDAIARRLALKPERFEEQAMKHSECPTALNGGLLGQVRRGELYPELDAALFRLVAGELSTVVESELGFHLLRCDAVEPERVLAYTEVAESLRARLSEERAERESRRWLAALLSKKPPVAAGSFRA